MEVRRNGGRRRLIYAFALLLCTLGIGARMPFTPATHREYVSASQKVGQAQNSAQGRYLGLPHGGVVPSRLRQRANFAALRSRPEGLPQEIVQIMHGTHRFGMRWPLAQKLPDALGQEVWVVPGHGHLCLLLHRAGAATLHASCATDRMALKHGLTMITLKTMKQGSTLHHFRSIIGLVPDRVRQVLLPASDGRKRLPVSTHHSFAWTDSSSAVPDELIFR
jgi:hypothetical protein